LTEEERQQLLPSGKQTTFANRVHWAKTFLSQAGLLDATKRAHFRIAERGRKVLAEGPARIDNEYLSQFAEFIQFRERRRMPGTPVSSTANEIPVAPVQTQTPDELLRSTVKQIETALRKELLDRVLVAPPKFFESLIVTLLLAVHGKILGKSSGNPVMVASTVSLTRMLWGSTVSTSRRNGMP